MRILSCMSDDPSSQTPDSAADPGDRLVVVEGFFQVLEERFGR